MLRLVRVPYLRLLLAITFFAILSKYLVDYAFLAQMKGRYGGARELATFFGVFSGATQVLSLMTRLFVSGPLLARHGIRVGLLVLPLAHALCTGLLVLVATRWGAAAAAVFWLVMMNQAIYKTLKHPIDNPSFKVLYQPLRPEQRLAAQIVMETIATPLTTGLAGGMMLLLPVAIPYDPVGFSCAMLAVFAGWVAVAARAGRAYSRALSEALRSRIVDEDLALDDERTIAVVKESLRSERAAEVVFALDLLEKARRPELGSILLSLLDHPSSDVRASVLSRVERVRPPAAADAVAARLAREQASEVRAAALRCLCALGGPEVPDTVAAYLEDQDPQVSRAAMIGLLGRGNGAASVAASRLASLAGSAAPEDRASAAHVIGQAGQAGFQGILRGLLVDGAAPVRRAALRAASRVKDPELWPAVTPSLGDSGARRPGGPCLDGGGRGGPPRPGGRLGARPTRPRPGPHRERLGTDRGRARRYAAASADGLPGRKGAPRRPGVAGAMRIPCGHGRGRRHRPEGRGRGGGRGVGPGRDPRPGGRRAAAAPCWTRSSARWGPGGSGSSCCCPSSTTPPRSSARATTSATSRRNGGPTPSRSST